MLIGISGKMGTGKSTVAKYLIDKLNKYGERNQIHDDWAIVSIGGAIKSETADAYGFPLGLCYSQKGKNTVVDSGDGSSATVRNLLQFHGTYRRQQDPDYWLKKTFAKIPENSSIIIDDIRMPNEASAVRKRLGYMVRIEPFHNWTMEDTDTTETSLDEYKDWDLRLFPSKGLFHLERCAEKIINKFNLVPAGE